MPQTILLTGAAGGVGTLLRPRLARTDRILRLTDIAPIPEPEDGERVELVTASITDLPAMCEACSGVAAVIHLGGLSLEGPWRDILDINIHGTWNVLEAARRSGVSRVILASSNHAVGFHPMDGEVPDYLFPRPDTYYGVSKVAGEALGSLYHDRYGMDVICVRIGSCFARPQTERMLSTWLSPDDCARLMEAAIGTPAPGFRVVWGVSANTRRTFSLAEAAAIGYRPVDDSEAYAGAVEPLTELERKFLGGEFCSPDLDEEDSL